MSRDVVCFATAMLLLSTALLLGVGVPGYAWPPETFVGATCTPGIDCNRQCLIIIQPGTNCGGAQQCFLFTAAAGGTTFMACNTFVSGPSFCSVPAGGNEVPYCPTGQAFLCSCTANAGGTLTCNVENIPPDQQCVCNGPGGQNATFGSANNCT